MDVWLQRWPVVTAQIDGVVQADGTNVDEKEGEASVCSGRLPLFFVNVMLSACLLRHAGVRRVDVLCAVGS